MAIPLIHCPLHDWLLFVYFQFIAILYTNFDHEHTDTLYLCGSSIFCSCAIAALGKTSINHVSLVGHLTLEIGITMATPNPFAMSSQDMPTVSALPTMGLLRRHGSAEQDNRPEGGTYLTSINTPRKTPRSTPRNRSPDRLMDNDDDNDIEEEEHQARESARKQSRRMPTPTVGIPFRIRATEQSIKEITNEVAAQRIMIQQLTEELQRQAVGKEAQDRRLNEVFAHVDNKFTEANKITQQIYDTAFQKCQVVTSTINSVAEGLAQRVEQMSMELEVVKRHIKETEFTDHNNHGHQPLHLRRHGRRQAPLVECHILQILKSNRRARVNLAGTRQISPTAQPMQMVLVRRVVHQPLHLNPMFSTLVRH